LADLQENYIMQRPNQLTLDLTMQPLKDPPKECLEAQITRLFNDIAFCIKRDNRAGLDLHDSLSFFDDANELRRQQIALQDEVTELRQRVDANVYS
jgi:hypothetical protein